MHFTTRQAAVAAALVLATAPAMGQSPAPSAATGAPPARAQSANPAAAGRPCTSVTVYPPTYLTLGKSKVVHLNFPASRIVVGGSAGSRAGRPVNLTPVPS